MNQLQPIVGKAAHQKTEKKLPVCVDFDGCMVAHHYPHIGNENHPCVEVLKKWQKAGVGIILDTMRCGRHLQEAVDWCREHGIQLYGIGKDPHQQEWTQSTKAYGVYSIDDRNLGVPLKCMDGEDRPVVDWEAIDHLYTGIMLKSARYYIQNPTII
ncbi:MAG: hypothetical protein LUC23_01025 [Prevotellaceae bacterium]|nr:hypothetical protein [Prevotellaceae bacterium]